VGIAAVGCKEDIAVRRVLAVAAVVAALEAVLLALVAPAAASEVFPLAVPVALEAFAVPIELA